MAEAVGRPEPFEGVAREPTPSHPLKGIEWIVPAPTICFGYLCCCTQVVPPRGASKTQSPANQPHQTPTPNSPAANLPSVVCYLVGRAYHLHPEALDASTHAFLRGDMEKAKASAPSLKIAMIAPPWFDIPPRAYGGIEWMCYWLTEGLVPRGHDALLRF
jgi:hypothetical protein